MDKPSGPTSHDAVLWARRALGVRRVGHCGSLDPMATGLLLIVAGEAAEWQDRFTASRKTYRARLRLGLATDTDDAQGRALPGYPLAPERVVVPREALEEALRRFVGPLEQRVPRYSAVKVGGRRLYELARQGVEVELPKKTVEVFRLELLDYSSPEADLFIECSKGTYIRALARDLGEALGVGAALTALCRETIGGFSRAAAYSWGGEREVRVPDLERAFIPLDQLRNAEFGMRNGKA